jgi:hypothetical protein
MMMVDPSYQVQAQWQKKSHRPTMMMLIRPTAQNHGKACETTYKVPEAAKQASEEEEEGCYKGARKQLRCN